MRKLLRRIGLSVALVVGGGGGLAVGLSATPAAAQSPTCTISWNNWSGGSWSTAADWTVTGGGARRVPSSTDDVCITLPGTYTVTLSAAVAVNEIALGNTPANSGDDETLTIESDDAALELAANSTSTIGADGSLDVGDATTGGEYALLEGPSTATVTNDGTLTTVAGSGGIRYLRSNLTNDGTVTIDSAATESDGGDGVTTTTNDGTFTVAATGSYILSGASFDNAGGSIANSGTLEQDANTFTQRGGTETGTPVIIDNATLDDDTSAGGGYFTFSGTNTLTGTGSARGSPLARRSPSKATTAWCSWAPTSPTTAPSTWVMPPPGASTPNSGRPPPTPSPTTAPSPRWPAAAAPATCAPT